MSRVPRPFQAYIIWILVFILIDSEIIPLKNFECHFWLAEDDLWTASHKIFPVGFFRVLSYQKMQK